MPDYNRQQLPLRVACYNKILELPLVARRVNAPPGVVQKLIEAYPAAAAEMDCLEGFTPP